ncbi:MAG: glycosyltransferase family protein [Woeseia sp.]
MKPLPSVGGDQISTAGHGIAALRVLLYSHDSWGLGHLRRSLAIAGAITARFCDANVLIVTGSPCATQFELPDRCDVLKLPAVSKDVRGQYIPRTLSGCVSRTIELRSRLILESYHSFDPHIVIVDHQLTGLLGEALGMLREARSQGKTLIYGMRDVLDAPKVVATAWGSHEHQWALAHAYDRICVYGTPEVFDPRTQYTMLEPFRHKIEFTGYIAAPLNMTRRRPVPSLRKKVLVTMGGGEDGQQRVDTYIRALKGRSADWDSHIVTGPLMDPSKVRHYKHEIHRLGLADRVRINRFCAYLPRLLQESDAVVSMAGYNSCAETMQSRVPAILMPRLQPRKEQLIRARRLEQMGLVKCISDADPERLRDAIEQALDRPDSLKGYPSLNGLDALCDMIGGLITAGAQQVDRHVVSRLKIGAA